MCPNKLMNWIELIVFVDCLVHKCYRVLVMIQLCPTVGVSDSEGKGAICNVGLPIKIFQASHQAYLSRNNSS